MLPESEPAVRGMRETLAMGFSQMVLGPIVLVR